jgi:hypothetical protein
MRMSRCATSDAMPIGLVETRHGGVDRRRICRAAAATRWSLRSTLVGDDLQSQALAVQRPVALRLVWAVFVAFSIYAVCAFAARVNAPADEATAETAIETSQRQAAGHSVGDDGAVVLLDVAMAIDSAVVRRADESQPCVAQPDRHRHVCGREDWAFTGRYYAQFGGRAMPVAAPGERRAGDQGDMD